MSKEFYGVLTPKNRAPFAAFLWLIAFFLTIIGGISSANAQVANEPWRFKDQNRASIAALMKQIDREQNATTATAAAPGDALVCGDGGGSSSSAGNATCIILNNANAAIEIGQTSDGEQQSTNTAPAGSDAQQSPTDEILSTLAQQQ